VRVKQNFGGYAAAVDKGLERTDFDEEAGFDAGANSAINLYKG
jgi:hypothetical protein